jgi:hypothetical protein
MPALDTIKMLMGQKSGGKGNLGQVMMMLRMARLLRILRLVRLVKNIPPLFTLIVGIAQAMQGMMWVVVLTIVVLYAFSLLGVKLIGQGLLLGPEPQEDVVAIFPSVFDSFFVLFKAMNGDWGSLEPLFEVLPASKGVLFLYTVVSTWGILSVLTAVVSDSMINSTAEQEAKEEEQNKREEDARRQSELLEIFEDIDHDDNGYVCKEEYEKMLVDVKLRQRLCKSADLTRDEIKQLFSFLEEPHPEAVEKNILEPIIYKRTFINGLKHNSRTVSERSVMRLENRIMRLELEMRAWGQQTLKDVLTHDATLQASQRVIAGDVSDFINDADREPPPENPYGTETTSLSRSRSANLKSPR